MVYSLAQMLRATNYHKRLWRLNPPWGFLIIPAVQTEKTHALIASLEGMVPCDSLWCQCQLYKQKKPMHPMLAWKVWYLVTVCGTSASCTNRRNPCTQC